jgi:hypothetical protein
VPYTALRVTERGVVLYDEHRRRLGTACEAAFEAFARTAAPGLYSLSSVDGRLDVTPRERSRIFDGVPVRYRVSPVAHGTGPKVKTPSPSPWDAVRAEGVATLLTSADGSALYEACVAGLLAWDGATLVAPPDEAPRIASVTEAHLLARHAHRRAPLLTRARWPLVLVNAVAGVCVPAIDRPPFPPEVLATLRASLAASAVRP